MRIALGSDHGGFEIKETIGRLLAERGIAVDDVGCFNRDSVDYPDYAAEVALRVVSGRSDQGVLVCTTGIGMSIAANRTPGIRAALCMNPEMARLARTHNDANVLVLGGGHIGPEDAERILAAWLDNDFSRVERHARRVARMSDPMFGRTGLSILSGCDGEIGSAIGSYEEQERITINLIASENYVSCAVREAQGSVLTNKYAEGYPGARWYNGCAGADEVERIAVRRAGDLFGAEHANVQPHCGSSANMAVYFSVLEPGDKILAMSLAHGGHLTHGHRMNFSGRLFGIVSYGVKKSDGRLDYDEIERLAGEHKPKLIVAGASAYPREIDFGRFREIADRTGSLLMADMAHIAGLVAGGRHQSPVPVSDFVTLTTHKTLRGPRSGMILCRAPFAGRVDKQVFPGIQGGPAMHAIAAKAVCLGEAMKPEFREYARKVIENSQTLAESLMTHGFDLVSGGTDNHLMLVDLTRKGVSGRDAADVLERAGIIANKNAIPFDTSPPAITSGLRFGSAAATTRGMGASEMKAIAGIIADVLEDPGNEEAVSSARSRVKQIAGAFPPP